MNRIGLKKKDTCQHFIDTVVLVPETCSDMFRFIIESFFITHADTNLNAIGNLLNQHRSGNNYPLNNPWLVRGDEWCQELLRRPQPKFTTSTDVVKNQ